ncbi:ABC-type transport system, involved in lipoprotein release, permease component [Saccharicrinis carchari]|uniref:ABC-type transport system, involved in lipoprotein release, permease component n=1 Tax=Saccharicrinis carchari TaxID=1168039 RepID=A0A521EAP8_SACCC|nr:FtsX-like permease family protein [Saccharicrinis carchari]SMO81006.1 ABC-type transport system, involved in lipoprotein release, permease component [Saccharicrinis carchari]
MILSIAWRNVWRSKTRSMVILIAIALGIFTGVFNYAFYNGMALQRINSAISTEASHIQLHRKGYLEEPDEKEFVPDAVALANNIASREVVKAASARFIVQGMIQSPTTSRGVKVLGIDPETESEVTNIHAKIIDGAYLEGIKRNPVVIGEKLADKLKLKVRSKVVITFADAQGYLSGASFRVAGIYRTSNNIYDNTNVFVRAEDLSGLYGASPNDGHEIAVLLGQSDEVQPVLSSLKKEYAQLDVKDWRELMPEVSMLESSLDISMYIFMIIILLALTFGIINTMLMAVLERTKELGMLMAIGMNKSRVFTMIMFETVLLSIIGGLVGIGVGILVTLLFANSGIDISIVAEGFGAMGYDSIVYPVLRIKNVIDVVAMVFVTGMLAAIYPALKALKLKPAEAIRIDM